MRDFHFKICLLALIRHKLVKTFEIDLRCPIIWRHCVTSTTIIDLIICISVKHFPNFKSQSMYLRPFDAYRNCLNASIMFCRKIK